MCFFSALNRTPLAIMDLQPPHQMWKGISNLRGQSRDKKATTDVSCCGSRRKFRRQAGMSQYWTIDANDKPRRGSEEAYLPNDQNALPQLSGSLSKRVLPLVLVQGTLEQHSKWRRERKTE